MAKVRSEYIKKLMNESNSLEEKLKDVAESTINSILEEKTNKNLRQILAEDEDSFSEEEVDDDAELGASDDSDVEGASADDEGGADDEWDDLEQYKDEDGEYDLRSMDKDELVKVLKVMSPDDAVRIVKNEDDTLTVTDEGEGEEYELELGDDDDFDDDDMGDEDGELEIEIDADGDDDDFDDEEEIEIDMDSDDDDFADDDDEEFEIELDESNLGYTDNYQKKTAMTTPDNHEPANPKSTYSMDGGVPTGTSKPWVGPKKKAPYDDEVNEAAGAFGKVYGRVKAKQHRFNNEDHGGAADVEHENSEGTQFEAQNESIKKQANQIFLENKQLKALMGKLHNQVNEAIVVNQSLGNMIKLITENSTTVNEKKDILRRFNDCTTREESNKLYNVISEELKRGGKAHSNVAGTINSQLSESRNRAVETPMYKSEDLSETLSFMARLDAIK